MSKFNLQLLLKVVSAVLTAIINALVGVEEDNEA